MTPEQLDSVRKSINVEIVSGRIEYVDVCQVRSTWRIDQPKGSRQKNDPLSGACRGRPWYGTLDAEMRPS